MGILDGYRQVTLYLDPEIYERVALVAHMLDMPVYRFVNQALASAVEDRTSPEQRKAVEVLVTSTNGFAAKRSRRKR